METQPQGLLAASVLEARVRRVALDAYESTLETVFANDPAVYVVRRLDVKLAMQVAAEPSAPALASGWGARMGAEVARAIYAATESANIVRFEDQADFIAHFLSDLLRDLAWQRWCYGAFARFRHTPRRVAVLAVLREEPLLLARVFRWLARLGSLREVLDLIDDEGAAALWREAVRPPVREPEPAEFLPFVRAALQIVGSLGLWSGSPLDERELLSAFAATRPPPAVWIDRRALASVVSSIVRLTERRGHIAIPHEDEFRERWSENAAELARTLDWFDLDWLGQTLAVPSRRSPPAAQAAPNARPSGPTPNQARLLSRLRQMVVAAVVPLDRAHPESEANALRLFAALAAAEPETAAHPATPSILKVLLAAWAAVERAADPIAALDELRAGRVPSPSPDTASERPVPLVPTSSLGTAAADVVHELMAHSPIRLRAPAADAVHTACAGLFLLVRAITEARIAPPAPVLFALGVQWSGVRDADPGLGFWSGLAAPEPAALVLDRLDPAVFDPLLARVRSILDSRASIDPGSAVSAEFASEATAALTEGWPSDIPRPDSIAALAVVLLRLWSRWLRGFAQSSAPYLLRQFIRRRGRIAARPNEIEVILRPAQLDVVLEMSGYLAPTPPVPWLGDRRVSFRIDRGHP
jgi:hypothetical protein